MTTPWTEQERALLDDVLDELLPATADGKLPAGSAVPIVAFFLARLSDTPDFAPALSTVLTALQDVLRGRGVAALRDVPVDERAALVTEVEQAHPVEFRVVAMNAHLGYYTEPSIPVRFGLPGWPPQPMGHEVPRDSEEALMELLAPVIARGPIFRDVK